MRYCVAAWLCLLLCGGRLVAQDRCAAYRLDVRREAERTLGLDYPWWYNLGQLRQESRCRADIAAFDGGQGLAQFMPATIAALSKRAGEKLDAYKPEHAIRLQAMFLADLDRGNPSGRLWPIFQAYNGGWTLLKREAMRAGGWDRAKMRATCQRRVLQLKSGPLDLCEVNYTYPAHVAKFGEVYRAGQDARNFW